MERKQSVATLSKEIVTRPVQEAGEDPAECLSTQPVEARQSTDLQAVMLHLLLEMP